MTLAQIIAAVQSNCKRQDKPDIAKIGVNLAFQRIVSTHTFRSSVKTDELTVQAGANSVALPSGLQRIYAVYWINDTQSWRLYGRSPQWVKRRVPNVDASPVPSVPQWAYIEGSQLFVVPGIAAGGTIRITYQFLPTLVNDVDENPLAGLDEAIISYATSWVFKSVQMFNEAIAWEQNYSNALALAIETDRTQPFDEKSFDERGGSYSIPPDYEHDPFAGHGTGWANPSWYAG